MYRRSHFYHVLSRRVRVCKVSYDAFPARSKQTEIERPRNRTFSLVNHGHIVMLEGLLPGPLSSPSIPYHTCRTLSGPDVALRQCKTGTFLDREHYT